jgi:predicted transposase YbfD/YdcC
MTDERHDAGELRVRLVRDDEVAWYNALMKEHHALGAAASGRVLRYVAEAGGVPLVLGTFGSAAWRVPVRDRHIGWDDGQRAARLERMCANQRLCVLPDAAGMRHAGSRALAAMLRALPADYLSAFGVRLMAVESFTDPAAHAGTVYKACGFTAAGLTAGYGRSRGRDYYVHHGQPKQLWLRELVPGGTAALAAGFDAPVLAGRRAPDFNRLRVSGDRGLLGYLEQVADHRKPKGVRHELAAILVVIVVARLCGANSVYAAAQFAQAMPQEALRRCGIRYNTRLGRHVPPSHKTIKRTIRKIDAEAADKQMCAWLRQEAAAGRLNWRHIAIDGKSVRGAVRPDGTRPHLLAAYDVTAGTVLGQADVEAKTNEITCFVPLLKAILTSPRASSTADGGNDAGNPASDSEGDSASDSEGYGDGEEQEEEGEEELVVVTADAMHTQAGHVEAMNELGVGWILDLKGNQPGLYALADAHPWDGEPVLHATAEVGHGRHEIRTIRVTSQVPEGITRRFPGTAQMMLIERYRHDVRGSDATAACRAAGDDPHMGSCAAGKGISCETVISLTALTPAQAGPGFLLGRNRGHWGVENGLHLRRDTTFAEDASRLRAGDSARLFASIASTVVSVLNRAGRTNHAAARRELGWERTGMQALALLGL